MSRKTKPKLDEIFLFEKSRLESNSRILSPGMGVTAIQKKAEPSKKSSYENYADKTKQTDKSEKAQIFLYAKKTNRGCIRTTSLFHLEQMWCLYARCSG